MIAVHNGMFIGICMGALVLLGSITTDASSSLYAEPVAVHQDNEQPDLTIHNGEQDTEIALQEQGREFRLLEVNKITLQDEEAVVVQKLGKPQAIIADPDISGMVTYEYKDMHIGFIQGMVEYVQVFPTGETAQIDETMLPITIEAITAALGKPDFEAEDGLVFQRNEYLLKIFIDETTREVVSVDYYHLSST